MKTLVLALCATMCLTAPSFAQSPDAAAPAGGPADQGGGDAGGGGGGGGGGGKGAGGGKMKELMQTCRTQAKGQGLSGKDMRQAVMDCVVKEHPGMAGRLKCRMAGMDKGLKPGDDLKAFVKDCMKKSG